MTFWAKHIKVGLTICSLILLRMGVLGQGTPISAISGSYTNAVQNTYSENGGDASSSFNQVSTYNVIFGTASTANNDYALSSTSSFTAGASFDFFEQATALKIRRNLISATGEKEVIGGEHWTLPSTTSGSTVEMRNSYFTNSEAVLNSMTINMSMDQTFMNIGSASFSNIERMDYIFPSGLSTPTTSNSGFAIFERGGNDHFQIAAILDIDHNGDPTRLGPLVYISSGSYGAGLKTLEQTVFYKEAFDTDYQPAKNITGQSIHGIFISFDDLAIQANEVCYGYALLNYDVTSNDIDWTDGSIYPVTSSGAGGVDFCPGGAAFSSDAMLEDGDHDDDGVSDLPDLDDDNDGILDSEEQCAPPAILDWTAAQINSDPTDIVTSLAGNAVTVNAEIISSSTADTYYGAEAYDYSGSVTADAGVALNGNVQLSLYQETAAGGETKVTFNITPGDFGNLNLFLSDFESTDFVVYAEDLAGNRLSSAAWDVSSYEQSGATPASSPNPFIVNATHVSFSAEPSGQNDDAMRLRFDTQTLSNATKIVVETTKVIGGGGDNAELMMTSSCPNRDTDNDGKHDYLDLDSDNDGIYDAVESGSGEAQTGGMLNGAVDSDGIPLSVSNGSSGVDYTYLDTDGDSTLNPYDSDSDGDTCPDVNEAGFPDADGDQQLGGLVPPTVDANGVVTSGGL